MSNVSIFEKKWIDLVFEGKNKEYGAYQLRQESSRTTLKAFLFGFVLIVSGTFVLSSFNTKPADEIIVTLKPSTDLDPVYPIDKPENETKPLVEETVAPIEEVPENKPPVVVATPDADPVVPTNDEHPATNQPIGSDNSGNSTGISSTTTLGDGGTSLGNENPKPNGIVIAAVLDAQPEFPGGIKKFYQYIGDNFEKQEIDEVESITVNVSFVIEKDGSMTDIKVLRNPGYGLDKEAIRVLKSLKTKWKPGALNGEFVRTQYNLPITLKVN
jgi:periplasmic protein TonB